MKKFSTLLILLGCALLAGFQAKATSYTLSQVNGSITMTSITSSTASNATVYNDNGTTTSAVTADNNVPLVFNFSGSVEMTDIQPGDTIKIPLGVSDGSHFATFQISFDTTVALSDGTIIFKAYYRNGNILLIAQPGMVDMGGVVDFNLQGAGIQYTTGATLRQLRAATATYVLDGTGYTINTTRLRLSGTNCYWNSAIVDNSNPRSLSAAITVQYTNYCIYDSLLANYPSALTNPYLNTNYIQVVTIAANTQITGVTLGNNRLVSAYMNYVMPDSSSVSSTNMTLWNQPASNAFTQVTVTDTSMANLQKIMKPGQYAIVKYPNGGYALIVDWGPFLNNPYTQFPSGANTLPFGDTVANRLVQQAIAAGLTALQNRLNFVVTFANPNIQNSVPATIRSNLSQFVPQNTNITNIPVNNTAAGQTPIYINYVNEDGSPICSTITTYGYPGTSLDLNPPTDTLGMKLLTPAQVQSFGTATILELDNSVDSIIVYRDTIVAYPSSGVLQIYYVYAEPIDLPITGLQLNVQAQSDNDVLLTWSTTTEINSKSFTVQRSVNGGKTWTDVGIVATKAINGNSSIPLTYQLTDQYVPVGSYEYRVAETDINGSTTNSNIVQIQITTSSSQIFPNPAKSVLNIALPVGTNNVPFKLISSDGKIVLSGTLTNQGNYAQISVAGVASAVYFLQVTVNNAVQTYKVQVQH